MDSANPSLPQLERLADEVLVSTIGRLGPQDLRRIRLTSKRLDTITVQFLFSSLTLRTSPAFFTRFERAAFCEPIAAFVREIRSCHHLEPYASDNSSEEAETPRYLWVRLLHKIQSRDLLEGPGGSL
ncbi:hypothetical protein K461DRAFT_280758 [Myriangium duriaei CBS 260.36]|uniref:F-box domain-containing protein n=1 Tax=Myriangium duriaei CBS 260.36 TaxID=1168546 RepID=A0A9P4MKF3_9PEZI|nr:hypothetical protein K461DRAFT_280758 [Myriangium duriaei CBS 260.36]